MTPLIKVEAQQTFRAAIDGHEVVQFIQGQVHARSFTRAEVAAWLDEKSPRLKDVTEKLRAAAAAKKEAAEKASADKAEADAKAAEEKRLAEEKLRAEEAAKTAAAGGANTPPADPATAEAKADAEAAAAATTQTHAELKAMNKEPLIELAKAEDAVFDETMNKAQIADAILAKRAGK